MLEVVAWNKKIMLNLENAIGGADVIVLQGGSAFGLDASSEIQRLMKLDGKDVKLVKILFL